MSALRFFLVLLSIACGPRLVAVEFPPHRLTKRDVFPLPRRIFPAFLIFSPLSPTRPFAASSWPPARSGSIRQVFPPPAFSGILFWLFVLVPEHRLELPSFSDTLTGVTCVFFVSPGFETPSNPVQRTLRNPFFLFFFSFFFALF